MITTQYPIHSYLTAPNSFTSGKKEFSNFAIGTFQSAQRKSSEPKVLNIKARGDFPANVLSNFSKTKFSVDGVEINSMEGFLQSLKVKDVEEQKRLCALSGFDAKKASKAIKREKNDILLFWRGKSFRKDSDEFKRLLSRVVQKRDNADANGVFKYAGKKISSVNSFLLGLKVKDPATQKKIFELQPAEVKNTAKTVKPVYDTRTLYWGGKSFSRDSKEYQNLLKKVYTQRFKQDPEFRRALRVSKNYTLCHSIGKAEIGETILTEKEFINLLKNMQKKDNFFYKAKDFLLSRMSKILKLVKKLIKR